MKNTSKSSKLLSFIMAFLILLVSLPTYALASLVPEDTSQGINEESIEEASFAQGELIVLEEDISLREENVKHFKLSNGTVKAVSYANAVHYLDAEGNWIDIDNSLTLNGSEYTANNKQEIKFANKSGSNGLLSIKDGEYKIDFTPLNTNKVSVEIENPEGNNSRKFDDVKKLNNIVSKATYKGIYEGIDLEYILVGNNIKENIIVNKKQEEYTYSFEIKLSKLNATLENNMVVLTDSDTGEKVYEIPAPYMVDANGEYSDKVEYTLTKDSKWKYTFTVKADPEWINEEERQLPVKIDPTVTVNDNIVDTFTMLGARGEEENELGGLESVIIGNFMGNYYFDVGGYYRFNSPLVVPKGKVLLKADLVLSCTYFENLKKENLYVGVYRASGDWDENSTYSTMNNLYDASVLYDNIQIQSVGTYNWDITSLYELWMKGESNYGLCVKAVGIADDAEINIRLATHENPTEANRPLLEITYEDVFGVEDYYAYAENILGDVGKSYVNLYNGALTYVNHLTSIEVGPNLTYNIDMVYNSIERTWRPSFAESIESYNQNGIEKYIWKDADGTIHRFEPCVEKDEVCNYEYYHYNLDNQKELVEAPTIFYPKDDIDYVLIKTENNEFILSDYDGNQKMFDSQGRLSKVCDAQGNVIYFYNIKQGGNENQSPRLSSIVRKSSDGNITEKIRFSYESSYNNLCYIYNLQNQLEIFIDWSTNFRIAFIAYNYANQDPYDTIEFEYYGDRRLKRAIDTENDAYLSYNYTSQKVNCVTKYAYFEDDYTNREAQQIIDVSIESEKTTAIDYGEDLTLNTSDDTKNECTFDFKGRKVVTNHTYNDELAPENIYYTIVYNTNVYKEPYNSAEAAAIAFSQRYYSSSYYIRHEYGAIIYSVTQNNTTTYNFTNVVYGGVHNVLIPLELSKGGSYVGDIHTHPFDVSFSDEDKDSNVGCGYLVIPTLEIKKYNYVTQSEYDTIITFSPVDLTSQEKELLCERFERSWQTHVSNDCTAESDCENHANEWPREILLP